MDGAKAGGLMLDHVEHGDFEEPTWIDVPWTEAGVIVKVGAHVLRAPVADQMLPLPVSFDEHVKIAKKLGWTLPTNELSDLIWKAATVRIPAPLNIPLTWSTPEESKASSEKMATLGMVRWLAKYNAEHVPAGREAELAADESTDWTLYPRAAGVQNYGWRDANGKPIQGAPPPDQALKKPAPHNGQHYDYSQALRPVQRKARDIATGAEVDLLDVFEKRGTPAQLTALLR